MIEDKIKELLQQIRELVIDSNFTDEKRLNLIVAIDDLIEHVDED